MSLHVREDRRFESRFASQVSRQEWVEQEVPSEAAHLNSSSSSVSDGFATRGNSGHHSWHRSKPSKPSGSSGVANGGTSGRWARHSPKTPQSNLKDRRNERGKERIQRSEGKWLKDENLPLLAQEIQGKLLEGTVECMICCDAVRRSSPTWSCSSCYSIFHLNCIKKWASAPTSTDSSVEKNWGINWRCPGCQSVQLTPPNEIKYLCFCGKRIDPPSDFYLTPHSCGESCGKPLKRAFGEEAEEESCPHFCVLQCHPGPCPPCKAFALPRLCPCGKETITTRCFDRKTALTCGQRCDKLLECGRHHCARACHTGPCNPCGVLFNSSCFCKKMEKVIRCGEMGFKGEFEAEHGVFSCDSTCGKELSCGNHQCPEICHPGSCGECQLLPSKAKTCCCGKTYLQEERRSCLEPIPTCSETCQKLLACGIHRCKDVCHTDECPPCLVPMTQKCRCGSTARIVPCHKMNEEELTCEKLCNHKKNCGRHRCGVRCCPQSNSSTTTLDDWDPHFCTLACDKKLRCGQHSCESLCHSGHCPPCLQTIFIDLTCACGTTSIPPPLPCGTPPPSCSLPCSVPQPCGHMASHVCHFGECPPCPVPVVKECIGGHVVLRNIPCGSTNSITCNKPCGKTRSCGLHACGRTCHAAPCDANVAAGSRASCGQVCGAPRRACRHTCKAPCHPSSPCPEARCDFVVTITCSCGRIKVNVPCDAGGSEESSIGRASLVHKLPPLQPVEALGKRIPLGQRKLMCDDECAKLERKRVLADAFNTAPRKLDGFHFKENSELVADLLRRDPKFVLSIEDRCMFLVLGKTSRGSASSLKVHVFCPMQKEKREAVRLIAERWKLMMHDVGREPKQFVVVRVTPKSKAPGRLLGDRGSTNVNTLQPPVFDPRVDMDPRFVVSFFDLPRESDISPLVLRFGGECELVWLDGKNALAVFGNMTRAATATRTLDHGSAYHGAAVALQNGGASALRSFSTSAWGSVVSTKVGAASVALSGSPWKKTVADETNQRTDLWGEEDWSIGSAASEDREDPIPASATPWNLLNNDPAKDLPGFSSLTGQHHVTSQETEAIDVVDDWEAALA